MAACAAPAWAVIPGLAGPLQALGQMLPQILPFFAAAAAGLLSSSAWRARLAALPRWITTPKGMACTGVAAAAVVGGVLVARSGNRSQLAASGPTAGGATQGSADWSMFRGNLARTGANAAGAGPRGGGVAWTFKDPQARVADFSSSPAVVGGRVYVGCAQASVFDATGMVYCVDAATGKQVWRFQTEKQVFSSPAVVGGKVYVGEGLHVDTGCKLYCLDAATGRKLWATVTKSHTESSPAVVGGRVYFGAGGDGVYCLDASTGKPVWHSTGTHVDISPAVSGGKVFLGSGYLKLQAMALDAATGKPLWTTPCDMPVWGDPTVSGKYVYYGIGNGDFVKSNPVPKGAVWCLEAATGKQVWRRDLPDAVVTAILQVGPRVVAGCRDGKVYALDAANGTPVWDAACGSPVVSSPAFDGKRLYAAGSTGRLFCLEAATGQPAWNVDLAPHSAPGVSVFSSPALSGGRLYLGTSKEELICVGPQRSSEPPGATGAR